MKRLAWPIALPPMLGGVVAAHTLAFRLTVPASSRAAVLQSTGHRWFAYLPLLFAAGAALLVLALVRRALAADRARPALWPFAVFPPLALFLQEQLERGHFALDTTIAAGVLLAIPLGLAAHAVLRALLHVSDAVARILRSRPRLRLPALRLATPLEQFVPASLALAPHGPRGPPSRARP
jgi:hypothetical protein